MKSPINVQRTVKTSESHEGIEILMRGVGYWHLGILGNKGNWEIGGLGREGRETRKN